ncbi:MAG: hypothetical protein EP335_05635 [Alphaproteobacteria bacterium]|nr:MAG: hypothetical protein EP335_05635 [Alphaproteobacteria bacterium]
MQQPDIFEKVAHDLTCDTRRNLLTTNQAVTCSRGILVMGDSHAGLVMQALRQDHRKTAAFGGAFGGLGQTARRDFFVHDDQGLRFSDAKAQASFDSFAREAGETPGNLLAVTMPVAISALGIDRMLRLSDWVPFSTQPYSQSVFVSRQMFQAIVLDAYDELLRFLSALQAANRRVAYIMCPGVRSNAGSRGADFLAARAILRHALEARCVPVADITEATCDATGVLLPDFTPEDPADQTHGNGAWNSLMAARLIELFQMS